MELLRGVSAANNFVLALVPLLSSQLFNSRSRPGGGVSNAARMQKTDHTHRRRAACELAAFHLPMPPVLPTERIADRDHAPPKIFSKEVAQKQAIPFPRQDLLTARNRF